MLTEKFIIQFVNEIKNAYNCLFVSYIYDEKENMYWIFHDNFAMESDVKFKSFIGGLMKKILFANNIENFGFEYDYDGILKNKFSFDPLCIDSMLTKYSIQISHNIEYKNNKNNGYYFYNSNNIPNSGRIKSYSSNWNKGNSFIVEMGEVA